MLYIIWVCFGMCGLIGRDALLQWPQTKQKIEKKNCGTKCRQKSFAHELTRYFRFIHNWNARLAEPQKVAWPSPAHASIRLYVLYMHLGTFHCIIISIL